MRKFGDMKNSKMIETLKKKYLNRNTQFEVIALF